MSSSRKSWTGVIMVFTFLALSVSAVDAQRITGQSAADAFSKGDFSNAYEQYSTLLGSFPRDPAYLYGAGVSLIKLSIKPEEAAGLLSRALTASSSVRSAPADTRFYLARALHLSGCFEEAAQEYGKYADAAGRREARERSIDGLIEQCHDQIGMLATVRPLESDSVVQSVAAKQMREPVAEPVPSQVPWSARVTPPDTLPKQTDTLLTLALSLRTNAVATDTASLRRSDSLLILAGVPVSQNRRVQPEMPLSISEDPMKQANASARTGAKAADPPLTVRDTLPARDTLTGRDTFPGSDKLPARISTSVSKTLTAGDTVSGRKADSIPTYSAASGTQANAVSDISGTKESSQQAAQKKPVISLFAIKEQPHYSPANQITVAPALPPGLLYTIQLAVFRNPVDPSFFKRLYPVFGVRIPGRELTTYYSGLFRTMADASKSLQSVRNEGFSDAFVVIFMDGKAISAERGALLEKEWGVRELPKWADVVPENIATPIVADTVPPTLLFRVEVLRTNKEDNKELTEEIRRVAGDRGFEIMHPANGIFIYIVGKFLTFESASAYADLLRRNGYKEAKVAAYAGNREIPIEVALKLFERKN